MAVCAGIKRNGGRCTATVDGPNDYCYQHDPKRAGERRRNASKAARSKPSRELVTIKRRIWDVIDAVLEGSQDRGRAAVALQGFNALRGMIELERKARELDELEARLEELEEILERQAKRGA